MNLPSRSHGHRAGKPDASGRMLKDFAFQLVRDSIFHFRRKIQFKNKFKAFSPCSNPMLTLK